MDWKLQTDMLERWIEAIVVRCERINLNIMLDKYNVRITYSENEECSSVTHVEKFPHWFI